MKEEVRRRRRRRRRRGSGGPARSDWCRLEIIQSAGQVGRRGRIGGAGLVTACKPKNILSAATKTRKKPATQVPLILRVMRIYKVLG